MSIFSVIGMDDRVQTIFSKKKKKKSIYVKLREHCEIVCSLRGSRGQLVLFSTVVWRWGLLLEQVVHGWNKVWMKLVVLLKVSIMFLPLVSGFDSHPTVNMESKNIKWPRILTYSYQREMMTSIYIKSNPVWRSVLISWTIAKYHDLGWCSESWQRNCSN